MDGRGFTAQDWPTLATFQGRCASPHDVDAGAAIFALGDTFNGRTLQMQLPQPVIWYDEDEEFAAVVVQAEVHETEEGEAMEVLGLLLPNGDTAVALVEDVEMVDESDPAWLSLLDADLEDLDGDDEDEDDDELIEADNDDDADEDQAELVVLEHDLDIESDDDDERR